MSIYKKSPILIFIVFINFLKIDNGIFYYFKISLMILIILLLLYFIFKEKFGSFFDNNK